MEIFRLTEISEDVLIAFRKLIPQLSSSSQMPTKENLEEIIKSKKSFLFLARDKEIVGALTLITYRIPTGIKVWIEDVVVDNKMRGKGIGEKLTQYAIDTNLPVRKLYENLHYTLVETHNESCFYEKKL